MSSSVPDEFICPLTLEIMQYPVMTKTGHNYEKKALMGWLRENPVCPLTRQPLSISKVVSNGNLKKKISIWAAQNNVELDESCPDDDSHRRFMRTLLIASISEEERIVSKTTEDTAEENDTQRSRVSFPLFWRRKARRSQ
mmetsp:Transcript_12658/g.25640  ORF Transcript_12658/g.25640 Transcript_12658/m.25640 type:complete len:140 (-) Transcript_12658:34-453(-)|eukprot:scaffold1808_cov158-Amphora_coffeaeformis.AAC.2